MHNKIIIPLLCLIIVVLLGLLFWRATPPPSQTAASPRSSASPPSTPSIPAASDHASQPSSPPLAATLKATPSPISAASPSPSPAPANDPAEAREIIHGAVITYDAKSLPLIAPYLNHPNPEIRRAALHGMLQMGESAAAPLLRAAADQAASPAEALEMLDAADYLELPDGTLLRGRSRRIPTPPPPSPGQPPPSSPAPSEPKPHFRTSQ